MAQEFNFIDLFAGCGGLSLGLSNAGLRGLFAVEKDVHAFKTLSHNLIKCDKPAYEWPFWLPCENLRLEKLLEIYSYELGNFLSGKVDLLAGGPPCQGFSTLGRRLSEDPRNQLFKQYLKVVRILNPSVVLIENVAGIDRPFSTTNPDSGITESITYAELIKAELDDCGYKTWSSLLYAKDFGIPQNRPRFILIGAAKNRIRSASIKDPFVYLQELRSKFLKDRHLDTSGPITTREAISDLATCGKSLAVCKETPRFKQGYYGKQYSPYQVLMHGKMNGAVADSHRLVNHRTETVAKFEWFIRNCPKGKKLDQSERGQYANKKHTVCILDPNVPAPTVTTLPDDLLHYEEPRILTVREMARLQSFPDSFEFKGKYTTGGKQRVMECPRYTQVGNAVPPLLAEALGLALQKFLSEVIKQPGRAPHPHQQG